MTLTRDALLKKIDKATAHLQDSIVVRCPFYSLVGVLLSTLARIAQSKRIPAEMVRKMQNRAALYPWSKETAFVAEFRELFDQYYQGVPQSAPEARDVVQLEVQLEEELVKLKFTGPIEKDAVREKWKLLPLAEKHKLKDRYITPYEGTNQITIEKFVTRRRILFAILSTLQYINPNAESTKVRSAAVPSATKKRDRTADDEAHNQYDPATSQQQQRLAALPQNKQEYEHFSVSPVGQVGSDREED